MPRCFFLRGTRGGKRRDVDRLLKKGFTVLEVSADPNPHPLRGVDTRHVVWSTPKGENWVYPFHHEDPEG